MRKLNRLTMTLALLIMAVGGAWAGETPLLTIESKDYTSFLSESKTFDDKVTVTFSDWVYNDGTADGWYSYDGSLLTVAGINGYTITSCKFYTQNGDAANGYTVEGESPSVYLFDNKVYTDANQTVNIGTFGVKKIEVYGELTEWELKPDETGKKWILADMPASDVELQVEYEPTKVTMAVNDKTMGTAEVAGQSKVEWTADTWKGWNYDTKEYKVDDITMTSSKKAYIRESTEDDKYKNSLSFGVIYSSDESTVTFSTTGDPFSRIEFTMIDDYSESNPNNPHILPLDNWTFKGKSAVWEGEATKSLTLQSCSTNVSKITFFKGAIPDGVTINGDGTFTVAKTATVTLKATPKEGYKFLYWEDDQTNTNPVREVTIESGMADMTYKAVFAEITYNVTFADGIEDADKWTATPNTEVKKETKVDIKYNGTKKVIGVKVAKDDGSTRLDESTVGMIVCTNGKAYPVNMKDNLPSGVTAVGIVAYKNGKTGLVMALTDEATNMNWGTATGNNGAKAHTPAVEGYSWKVPTIGEWQYNIFTDAGVGNLAGLSTYMTAAGGTGLQNGCYWTSTPKNNSYYARCIKIENGSINFSPGGNTELKSNGYLVRAVFAF